jgi:hypothetical protein
MRTFNVVANDFNPFNGDFVDYLDDFNPDECMALDDIRIAGTEIIPPLLRSLEAQGLRAVMSHQLITVAKLHHASGGRMKRIIQTNDPRFQPNAAPTNTMVLALLRDGVPQGCIASRVIWCERSLKDEMESGRFWVARPATMWTGADRCIVRAMAAKSIRACNVVFTGSVYLAQEMTGGQTLAAMVRLHNIWVLCHWRWSWILAMIEGAIARRHVFDVYGLTSLDMGLWRTRPGEGEELHKYELASCDREAAMESWLRPETGDLTQPMGRPPSSVLALEGRNAERAFEVT